MGGRAQIPALEYTSLNSPDYFHIDLSLLASLALSSVATILMWMIAVLSSWEIPTPTGVEVVGLDE
jgi:hypothetical protein